MGFGAVMQDGRVTTSTGFGAVMCAEETARRREGCADGKAEETARRWEGCTDGKRAAVGRSVAGRHEVVGRQQTGAREAAVGWHVREGDAYSESMFPCTRTEKRCR
ncbi:hypothetical protein GUJ93_ZPchr0011g27688 [Zizania palustris]|uniref:Uncharacterized protein n=1 Tax=Zizania palustris TaxID=103762 RepID=A0A8J5WI24_ZIZPA|nr:hypothetical protein GUJ93_ZPchr0011g27688 [Zizania palustris]